MRFFNMIPLPPLDGGRVAVGLLPASLAVPFARLERYGMLIIIGLLFVLPMLGAQLGMNLNILGVLLGRAVDAVIGVILQIAGIA
jgi:Zn-dependent protease